MMKERTKSRIILVLMSFVTLVIIGLLGMNEVQISKTMNRVEVRMNLGARTEITSGVSDRLNGTNEVGLVPIGGLSETYTKSGN